MAFKPNPSLFRKLNEPFEFVAKANEALQGFQDELHGLREKYHLANMLFVISVQAVHDDGEPGEALICAGFGDPLKFESMAAYAFGREQAERQERITKLLTDANSIHQPLKQK